MKTFIKIIEKITNVFGLIAGTTMLLGVALIIIEIVLRKVFDSTIYITEEYIAYFLVSISFFSLAYTLKEDGHIRVNFLFNVIKEPKKRIVMDVYSFIVGLIVFSIITIVTANFFWDSVLMKTQSLQISRTYLAIPQSTIPIGSLIITLQFAAEICKSIIKFHGNRDRNYTKSFQEMGR